MKKNIVLVLVFLSVVSMICAMERCKSPEVPFRLKNTAATEFVPVKFGIKCLIAYRELLAKLPGCIGIAYTDTGTYRVFYCKHCSVKLGRIVSLYYENIDVLTDTLVRNDEGEITGFRVNKLPDDPNVGIIPLACGDDLHGLRGELERVEREKRVKREAARERVREAEGKRKARADGQQGEVEECCCTM